MRFLIVLCIIPCILQAQFAPAAGQPGSTAIHKDSAVWACWASDCQFEYQGYQNIANPAGGLVNSGQPADALGPAGDAAFLSLGDGGIVVLSFPHPIQNGPGYDFAVFENAFNDSFLELAFVEVSSDGQRFVRFPAISNSDTSQQVGPFGAVDPSKLYNLAGKYRASYGTPFDLAELEDSTGIDLQAIRFVRIIDVVGSILPDYANRDSRGIIINDPWATPFPSSGFDLDAIGVIHANIGLATHNYSDDELKVYPNPCQDEQFWLESKSTEKLRIFSINGQLIHQQILEQGKNSIRCKGWTPGLYLLKIGNSTKKILLR